VVEKNESFFAVCACHESSENIAVAIAEFRRDCRGVVNGNFVLDACQVCGGHATDPASLSCHITLVAVVASLFALGLVIIFYRHIIAKVIQTCLKRQTETISASDSIGIPNPRFEDTQNMSNLSYADAEFTPGKVQQETECLNSGETKFRVDNTHIQKLKSRLRAVGAAPSPDDLRTRAVPPAQVSAASAPQSYLDFQAALHEAQSPRAPASANAQGAKARAQGRNAQGRQDAEFTPGKVQQETECLNSGDVSGDLKIASENSCRTDHPVSHLDSNFSNCIKTSSIAEADITIEIDQMPNQLRTYSETKFRVDNTHIQKLKSRLRAVGAAPSPDDLRTRAVPPAQVSAASAPQSYLDFQAALHEAQSPRAPASANAQGAKARAQGRNAQGRQGMPPSDRWAAISQRVQSTASSANDNFDDPDAGAAPSPDDLRTRAVPPAQVSAASAPQSYLDRQAALHEAQSPRAPASANAQGAKARAQGRNAQGRQGMPPSDRWAAISQRVQSTASSANDNFDDPDAGAAPSPDDLRTRAVPPAQV
jgi:plasmid maintenance system killer protein